MSLQRFPLSPESLLTCWPVLTVLLACQVKMLWNPSLNSAGVDWTIFFYCWTNVCLTFSVSNIVPIIDHFLLATQHFNWSWGAPVRPQPVWCLISRCDYWLSCPNINLDIQTASCCWDENLQVNTAHSQTATTARPPRTSQGKGFFHADRKNSKTSFILFIPLWCRCTKHRLFFHSTWHSAVTQ